MRKTLALLLVVLWPTVVCSSSFGADEPLPPRVFPHPDRIRYDGQCFTIEGKDTFIFSGAFHYFRCPKELWNDRFDKIKAAGFNAVETYVAWNAQEPEMPASVDDYSKANLKDLDDWLTMAEAHGLNVILRPGPYICAEWDCGGYPQWLITKRPANYQGFWLRSDEPTFVAVEQALVSCRRSDRGEASIDAPRAGAARHHPVPVGKRVRRQSARSGRGALPAPRLGQQAMDDGIDIPLFTCWTGVVRGSRDPVLRQVYDSCNFYTWWDVQGIAGPIAALARQQPDAPLQTTELQGGWFGNVGHAGTLSDSWTG